MIINSHVGNAILNEIKKNYKYNVRDVFLIFFKNGKVNNSLFYFQVDF